MIDMERFIEMTGASEEVARFYIESAKGDVEKALDAYFESGGEVGDVPHQPEPETGADDGEDDAQVDIPGGAEAGPATLDDLTKSMFEKAEKSDTQSQDSEPSSKKRSFMGKGFMLGKEVESPSREIAQDAPVEPKNHKVTVWKGNAFQLNDGPVRYPDRGPDQEVNRRFMEDLARNVVPDELRERASNGTPIPVTIALSDHRDEDPSNAKVVKPKFEAFKGGGNVLGKDWTEDAYKAVKSASSASSKQAAGGAAEAPQVDKNKPTTTIQVRLPDGQRSSALLNLHMTVGDLRRWIEANHGLSSFQISAGFPPQVLSDDKSTIEGAGLANACATIKLV